MKCSWTWGAFHVGIYLGKNCEGIHEVIDYTDDSEVHRIHLDDFLTSDGSSSSSSSRSKRHKGGSLGDLYRVRYSGITAKYNPKEVVERALTEFKRNDFGEFDAIFNNCEHFVTFCTFGKRFSYQIAKKVNSWWKCNYTL